MLKCKNLKVNIILKKYIDFDEISKENVEICEKKISVILRLYDFSCVITVYKHSLNSLHITGIKTPHILKKIICFLSDSLNNVILETKIDNSLFSCKFNKIINLHQAISIVQKYFTTHSCSLVEEVFPALFIKPNHENKIQGCPTIILFHNCSYVIIGGKKLEKIKLANIIVKKIMEILA